MKKTRQRYDREFKISVIAEIEGGKPLAQIAREHGIHPSLPSRWRDEFAENPEKAFPGNGNWCKENAGISEQERILEQLYPDIDILRRKSKKGTGQIFTMIQDALIKNPQLSVRKSCQLYRASCSGYYKWKKRPVPAPSARGLDNDLIEQIQEIVLKFPKYGYRRVTAELRNHGYVANHKRVLRIMRDCNLLCLKNHHPIPASPAQLTASPSPSPPDPGY
jgi:transposase